MSRKVIQKDTDSTEYQADSGLWESYGRSIPNDLTDDEMKRAEQCLRVRGWVDWMFVHHGEGDVQAL